jgi:hypothetical protein
MSGAKSGTGADPVGDAVSQVSLALTRATTLLNRPDFA